MFMTAHNKPAADAPLDLSRWRKAPNLLMGVGLVLAVIGILMDSRQFGYSWLTAYMFFLSFCLGALFLVIMHHLFDASWSVPVRRLVEHGMAVYEIARHERTLEDFYLGLMRNDGKR